jgi:hypothetical protein
MSQPGRREAHTAGEQIRRAQDAFRCENQVIRICCRVLVRYRRNQVLATDIPSNAA